MVWEASRPRRWKRAVWSGASCGLCALGALACVVGGALCVGGGDMRAEAQSASIGARGLEGLGVEREEGERRLQGSKAPRCFEVVWKADTSWGRAFRNFGYSGKRGGYVEFWHADDATARYLCNTQGHPDGYVAERGVPDAKGWKPYYNLEVVRHTEGGRFEALCTSGADCYARRAPYIAALRCCDGEAPPASRRGSR